MEFCLAKDEFGRLVCEIADGPTHAVITASDAAQAAGGLAGALRDALGTAGSGECFWEEAGGQYRWLFKREIGRLRVVILWSIGTLTGWENKFWVECDAEPFARQVGDEVRRLGIDAAGLPAGERRVAVSAATLRLHLDYSAWASRRLLDAASRLSGEERLRDFSTADKSVTGTLVHIFGADRTWLRRLRGEPATAFLTDEGQRWEVLETTWPAQWRAWRQWASGLTDDATQQRVRYHDLKGNSWEQPVWQIVLHVVNHATHHRGQVAGFLRAMGHRPPPMDLIAYYRELAR